MAKVHLHVHTTTSHHDLLFSSHFCHGPLVRVASLRTYKTLKEFPPFECNLLRNRKSVTRLSSNVLASTCLSVKFLKFSGTHYFQRAYQVS